MRQKLLSQNEARVLLAVSTKTLYNYRTNNGLPFVRIGGKIQYKMEDLENFINNNLFNI